MPSRVVETEDRPPETLSAFVPNASPYSLPSAERSSTRIEMNAGTRTTRGEMRPPRPVKSASV
jgi:hypothetical protein